MGAKHEYTSRKNNQKKKKKKQKHVQAETIVFVEAPNK
jgi:hypothetical protein